jgi:hypothetical protein
VVPDEVWDAARRRERAAGLPRPMLIVRRASGVWYHASPPRNRESIAQHGLDWHRTVPPGIAGSTAAEWAGVFLCSEDEGAEWFAEMPVRRGLERADIWEVRLDGFDAWLEGDPNSDLGGGENWMICPVPIPPERLRLLRASN